MDEEIEHERAVDGEEAHAALSEPAPDGGIEARPVVEPYIGDTWDDMALLAEEQLDHPEAQADGAVGLVIEQRDQRMLDAAMLPDDPVDPAKLDVPCEPQEGAPEARGGGVQGSSSSQGSEPPPPGILLAEPPRPRAPTTQQAPEVSPTPPGGAPSLPRSQGAPRLGPSSLRPPLEAPEEVATSGGQPVTMSQDGASASKARPKHSSRGRGGSRAVKISGAALAAAGGTTKKAGRSLRASKRGAEAVKAALVEGNQPELVRCCNEPLTCCLLFVLFSVALVQVHSRSPLLPVL